MTGDSNSRGVALVITLLAVSLLSALGLGLVLTVSASRFAQNNYQQSVGLLNAAEAAMALASRDLASIADWTDALDGSLRSGFVDAPAPGVLLAPAGASIDIPRLTNELTCGRATTCSDAQVRTSTRERPWGRNNPRWQPFVYTELGAVTDLPASAEAYVVVWIGDDPSETDDNPLVDGGGADGEGRDIVRARAEAFGIGGARRAIEVEFARVCRTVGGIRLCLPGIRVQSWRVVTAVLP